MERPSIESPKVSARNRAPTDVKENDINKLRLHIAQEESSPGRHIENCKETESREFDGVTYQNQPQAPHISKPKSNISNPDLRPNKSLKSLANRADTFNELPSKYSRTLIEGYQVTFTSHNDTPAETFICEMQEPQLKKYEELLEGSIPKDEATLGGSKASSAMMEWAKVLQKHSAPASNMTESKNKLEQLYSIVVELKPRNWYEELVSLYKVFL